MAFGVVLPILSLLVLGAWVTQWSTLRLADQDALVGHSAVISAPKTFESVPDVPFANAKYKLTFPADAPGALAGSVHEYDTPTQQLFSGDPFPDPADFRISYTGDGGYTVDGPHPHGSLHEITKATVAASAPKLHHAYAIVTSAMVAYLILIPGLLIVAIVQTSRRSSVKAAIRRATPTWTPDPNWRPPTPR